MADNDIKKSNILVVDDEREHAQVMCEALTRLGHKCDVTYNLVAEWDWATSRWFDEESRGPIRMLKKAIQTGHGAGHRVTHLETSGVVVRSVTEARNS